jgi:hypothetical protein
MLPIPVTTFLGLPLAIYALVGGTVAARSGRRQADVVVMRRATWGARLGCAGFVYLGIFYLVAGGLLLAGALAAFSAALRGTP